MMRGFSILTKAVPLAALMIFVGCSGDDTNRVTDPDPDSGAQVIEVPMAPMGPNHRSVAEGDLLRWNAPANADDAAIAGYNVYVYDPQPESTSAYVRLNTSLVAAGRLVTSELTTGQTYWFRVAAVNANDEEGTWSEPTSFVAAGVMGDDGRGGLGQQEYEQPDSPDPYQP
jgi:hypothetical protein